MSILSLAKLHPGRSVFAAGFLFTILWVATLHWIDSYDSHHPESLSALAWRGQPVVFTLDKPACASMNLGELICGRPYLGKYRAATNTWRVKGPTNKSEFEVAASFHDAPPQPGAVSIWGFKATFDDAGNLKIGDRNIGTVSLPVGNWVMSDD